MEVENTGVMAAHLLDKLEMLRTQQAEMQDKTTRMHELLERMQGDEPPLHGLSWPQIYTEFVYLPAAMAVSLVLLWPLLGFLLRSVESGCCGMQAGLRSTRFRHSYVGLHERLPKMPTMQRWFVGAEVVTSSMVVVIFVVMTARQQPLLVGLQQCLAVFFVVRLLLEGLREEFFVHSLLQVTVVIDIFTIPSLAMQSTWLSLAFLRITSAVLAYERWKNLATLDLSMQVLSKGELYRKIVSMVLRMVALIFSFAGITFTLETLGECPIFKTQRGVDTDMGELSMFVTVYWVVETLTTVGYGDYAPTTPLSKASTICCMLAGILFFTLEMAKFAEVVSNQKFGMGQYERPRFVTAHVVLMGGCVSNMDEDLMGGFLDELFSKNSHPWPDLVIMGPDSDRMIQLRESIQDLFHARPMSNSPMSRITFMVGSPLRVEDLERCKCTSAKLIYILPDTSGLEATANEDKSNILTALSVKDVCPHVSFRLMLLDGLSRLQATDAGILPERCFSVDEFRGAMLWESVRCPGWSTILSNLLTNIDSDQLPISREKWWGRYARGLDLEVYGFLVDPAFYGVSVTELALRGFQKNGVCVVAAVLETGSVALLPCKEKVDADMVVFAISGSKSDLKGLEDTKTDKDWMNVMRETQARQKSKQTPWSRSELWKTQAFSSKVLPSAPHSTSDAARERDNIMKDLPGRVQRIREAADKTPFLLVVNLAAGWRRRAWRHFGPFFQKLRREYPGGALPIVMLCRTLPDDNDVVEALGLRDDQSVTIYVGEPTVARDLEMSGAKECLAIVCSSTSVLEDRGQKEAPEMQDADAVLVHRVLEGMGQSHKHTLLEFRHTGNLRLLPRKTRSQTDRASRKTSKTSVVMKSFASGNRRDSTSSANLLMFDDRSEEEPLSQQLTTAWDVRSMLCVDNYDDIMKPNFGDLDYAFDEHFASGSIFTPRILGTLMGAIYRNRAVLEVVQAFLLLDGDDGGPRNSFCQVSPGKLAKLSYAKAFEQLANDADAPAVPLCLRRLWSNADMASGCEEITAEGRSTHYNCKEFDLTSPRYVINNPEGGEEVHESDIMLVLASPEFVDRAKGDGQLLSFGASVA